MALLKKLKLFIKNVYNRYKIGAETKIFCIGLNKTGTSSLLNVLRDHGYIFGNFGEGERLIDAYEKNEHQRIVNYAKNYNAYKDVPMSLPEVFKTLDAKYHNAKFILTIRDDADQWYNSITRFHAKVFGNGKDTPSYNELINCDYCYKGWAWKFISYTFNTSPDDPYNKDKLIEVYNNHHEEVIEYFSDKPEKLLVINVANDESYLKLCDFLNLIPKYEKFPWVNKTSNK